jgi:hypothetical protein
MRKDLTLPLAIVVASLVLGGCVNRAAEGTAGSPAQPTPSASAPVSPTGSASAPVSPAASAAVLWPAPADPLGRTVAAGLEPAPKEYLVNHVHTHLDVFVDGVPVTVPAGIGINIADPAVRRFDEPEGSAYGGIDLCNQPCISPLHTHDVSGIIHTESRSPTANTLGEFFIEWNVALTDSCVGELCSPKVIAFYVNGERYTGDPNAIALTDLKEIAIVIGTPPSAIPKTADFSKA